MITRKVEGVQNTTMLASELAQILHKDLAEAKYRCDVKIEIRPSDDTFLNPHDSRVGYVDYTVEIAEVGHVGGGHGFYTTGKAGRR